MLFRSGLCFICLIVSSLLVISCNAQQVPIKTTDASASAQSLSSSTSSLVPTDITILVFPKSYDAARLGIAYRTKVSHQRVRAEIERLGKEQGWILGKDLEIMDDNTTSSAAMDHGTMTLANCSVTSAPQVIDQVPQVAPYLQTFQAWDHVEVLFFIPPLPMYHGIKHFNAHALTVTMRTDQGGYCYDAAIREHTGPLPLLVDSTPAQQAAIESIASRKNHPGNALAWMLVLVGVGLAGGGLLYLLFARRTVTHVSASILRH